MASTGTPEIVSAALSARIEALRSNYGGPPSLSKPSDLMTTNLLAVLEGAGMPTTPVLGPLPGYDLLTPTPSPPGGGHGPSSGQALLASGSLTPQRISSRKRLGGSPPRNLPTVTYRRRVSIASDLDDEADREPDLNADVDNHATTAHTSQRVLRSSLAKARAPVSDTNQEKDTTRTPSTRGRKRTSRSEGAPPRSDEDLAHNEDEAPSSSIPAANDRTAQLNADQQRQILDVLRILTRRQEPGGAHQAGQPPQAPAPTIPNMVAPRESVARDPPNHNRAFLSGGNPSASVPGPHTSAEGMPMHSSVDRRFAPMPHTNPSMCDYLPLDPIVLDDEDEPATPPHPLPLTSSLPELSSLPPLPSDNRLDSARVRWTKDGYRQQFEEFEAVQIYVLHALKNLLPLSAENDFLAAQCQLLDKAVARCKSRMRYIMVANAGGGYDVADLHRCMEAGDLAFDRMVVRAKSQAQALRAAKYNDRRPSLKAPVPRHNMKLLTRRPSGKSVICYSCHEPGHVANACPKRREGSEPTPVL